VIDYEIYSGFDDGANFSKFVDLLADDIRDKDPDANFLFLYGDTGSGMKYKNYGTESANVGGEDVAGASRKVFNAIYIGGSRVELTQSADTHNDDVGSGELGDDSLDEKDVVVEVSGHEFTFPISKYRKVIFIIQKDVKDESFVSAK
jgi:hypothetical protein